jgi:hypothetical protein
MICSLPYGLLTECYMQLEMKISTKFHLGNGIHRHVVYVKCVPTANQVTYLISYLGR